MMKYVLKMTILIQTSRQRRLLNQWGYFWKGAGNFELPFWIEKTPTNAVASRYPSGTVASGFVYTCRRLIYLSPMLYLHAVD